MSHRLLLVVTAIVGILLVAPAASAWDITIADLPAESSAALGAGDRAQYPFKVSIAAGDSENFVCAQAASITVTLTATRTEESMSLNATVEPASLTFSIPAGAHLASAGQPYQGAAQDATLNVAVGSLVPPMHTAHGFGVEAAYNGGQPNGCQPEGAFAETSSEAQISVRLTPSQQPNASPTPTGGAGGGDEEDDGETNDSPMPGVVLVLVAIGIALLRRR